MNYAHATREVVPLLFSNLDTANNKNFDMCEF